MPALPGGVGADGRMMRRRSRRAALAYYRTHFLEALLDDGIVCLECGAVRRSLPHHVGVHGLRADEYRARWGYNRKNPLMVPGLVQRKRRLARRFGLAGFAPPGAALWCQRRPRGGPG